MSEWVEHHVAYSTAAQNVLVLQPPVET